MVSLNETIALAVPLEVLGNISVDDNAYDSRFYNSKYFEALR